MSALKDEQIEFLLQQALAESARQKLASSIVIVDAGGHVLAARRPAAGRFANIEIARKKAWTAAAFQRPTSMVRSIVVEGAPGYGLQHTTSEMCIVGGGIPILNQGGELLGAIGASGGSVEQDIACCMAGLEQAGFRTVFVNPHAPNP
ncbi:MAG: heme-binding protein [Nevskiaceae bacterium]|nr:MAG: heme-binding protein [Nevskiaceae bacterium]TBR74313.1 MAG: heme-binding protein [Nevskiaceae bacterium]